MSHCQELDHLIESVAAREKSKAQKVLFVLISARDKPIFKFQVQQEALISFQRQWEEMLGPQNQHGVRSKNTQQTTT